MASFSYELEGLIVMKNEWYIDKEFTLASRSLNSTSQLASKWRHFLFRVPCLARISRHTLSINGFLHIFNSSSSSSPFIGPSFCDLESIRTLSQTISLFTKSFSTRCLVKLSLWLVCSSVNFLQNCEESHCREEALTGLEITL